MFSNEIYSLHLLRFALIICTWRLSTPSNAVPIHVWHMKSSCLQVLIAKFTMFCLTFTILLERYFRATLNLCLLNQMFKRQTLQLEKAPRSYLMMCPSKIYEKFIKTKPLNVLHLPAMNPNWFLYLRFFKDVLLTPICIISTK